MKQKDVKYILIFGILILGIGVVFVCSPFLFGSKTDWLGQHVAFPNYFRDLFYETKNLFPNFAFQLGSGQNIFHFTYYGLWNPFILLSYLFPMIPMPIYLMSISLLCIFISLIFLYFFLKKKLGTQTSFLCCLIYLLACPIIFHAHRHLMFVNYMPFLILGLIGVDRYFEKNKSLLLTGSIFLMILTSYYYSIGGIASIVIYGIYRWSAQNKWKWKSLLHDGIRFLIPIILGVLLSSFLLLPTAYCLLSGRETGSTIFFLSLFIPNWNLTDVLYSTYSLGLTSIWIYTLAHFMSHSKRENRLLGFLFLCICFLPVFSYLLNGTLYVRTKVLIPFLPLAIYMIGVFLNDLWKQKLEYRKGLILLLFFHLFVLVFGNNPFFYFLDAIIMLICIFMYHRYLKKALVIIPLFIIALIPCLGANQKEGYVTKKYSDYDIKNLVQQIDSKDIVRTGIEVNTLYGINQIYSNQHYSTSLYSSINNNYYHTFFTDTLEQALPYRNQLILATTNNILFQTLMGEKYSIRSRSNKIGSHLLKEKDNLGLYENEHAFPVGYGMNYTLSEAAFHKLASHDRANALLKTIVVSNGNTSFTSDWIELKGEGKAEIGSNLTVQKKESQYIVDALKKDKIIYTLDQPLSNQIVWLEFTVEKEQLCKDGDLSIVVNGISNKLTCSQWQYKNNNHTFTYVLSEEELKAITLEFSKGHFELSNIQWYQMSKENLTQELSPFIIDAGKTKGDKIEGTINQLTDGYFVLTVPYDRGFSIYVDGKKIDYEKVNTAFLGFPLSAGEHHIQITYQAPYAKIGILVTLLSLSGVIVLELRKKRHA